MSSSILVKKMNAALGRFQAGELAGAERLCNEILKETPGHSDALHLLGLMRLTSGRAGEAVTLLGRALGENSRNPDLLENLGVAHLAAREYGQAETVLRRALELGAARGSLYMRLGLALSSQGRDDEAVAALGTAAEMIPGDPDVHLNLGNALAGQERDEEALACYRKVLALRPRHVNAHYNIGTLFRRMGRNDEAVSAYQSALALAPDYADCHNNLGGVYDQIGRLEEAAGCYRKALELDPQHAPAHSNLGNVLRLQGRPAEAQWHLDKALEIDPDFVDALLNLGTLRAEQGRFAEVRELYRKALAIDPDDPDARFNYAGLCLAQGAYEDGWANFRWRAARIQALKLEQMSDAMPPEDLSGKTLLVLGEQGIGDELFFLRFAPRIKDRGARLVCQCNRKLKSLVERTGIFEHVAAYGEATPAAEWRVLVGDLPFFLNDGQQSASARPLPLSVLDGKTATMHARLARAGPPPYLGLTWRSGTPLSEQRVRGRSLYKEVPRDLLASALERFEGTVVVLQRQPLDSERDALSRELKRDVVDLSTVNEDLEDMFALLALIDEYVGVSNTNMHLMAGLGRTARVLVTHPPEWRWMLREGDSPWFPGFKTYRQKPGGDWSSALASLADDLDSRGGRTRHPE